MAWDPRAVRGCSMAMVWARVPCTLLGLLSGCAWPHCSPKLWSQQQIQGVLAVPALHQLREGLAGVSHVPGTRR